ncbi:IS4 family transposase [Pantoea agglomerans]|uniref:IS4 family transposase n=1 Tax=Enterobacter agglomerans TaxID=549 RepID=UPI003DA11557
MPAHQVCQKFFRDSLLPFHKYRQNALLDATTALINGASLSLTSIGRFMPGGAQVKNKIKRADRLLGNQALQKDVPLIFSNIISMLTSRLSLCVIAVDWSGYPTQDFHILRASLVCDGRSIPLLSQVVASDMQQNAVVQSDFLSALSDAIGSDKKVIIITDAGFRNTWFRQVKMLGWDFIGRVRGAVLLNLHSEGDRWRRGETLTAAKEPISLGAGSLARDKKSRCDGYFYLHKQAPKMRKNKRARGRLFSAKTEKEQREAGREPWLIFTSTTEFEPRKIMKLYSRRMQIEQNFRDEKSERYGLGLRTSYSRSAGRLLVLSLLATLSTIVMWLLGYHAENRGLHLRYQANSIKSRRVISYLTLAKNILRHSSLILRQLLPDEVLNHLAHSYQNMVMIY